MTENHLSLPLPIPRHPELVSGSILRTAQVVIVARWMLKRVQHDGGLGFQRRQPNTNRQIDPLRVFRFNQIDLPLAMPVLQLFFARDRTRHIVEHFKPDEPVDSIFGRIAGGKFAAMLIKAREQVRRYADIQRAIRLAGQYIDARVFGFWHSLFIESRWTLKQVQGDEL